MNIFYPEYIMIAVFLVVASWRIIKDAPDSDVRKRKKRTGEAGKSRNIKKAGQRKGLFHHTLL